MSRPTRPPGPEFFESRRPEAGPHWLGLHVGSLAIEMTGLGRELSDRLNARFAPYSGSEVTGDGALRVQVGLENLDYFIDPPERAEFNPVRIECDGDRVRYLGYRVAGWFDVSGGRGDLILAAGEYEPAERAIENFIRAAVAWQAATRGGALVHGASAIWNERAYLFFGPSGVGKSTLVASNRRARVVSDDLSLLLPADDGRLGLAGSPFRGTYEKGQPVVGSTPLVAGFRLFQASRAEVRSADRVQVFAELVGSLPFVAEAFKNRPDLFERTERAFAAVPLAHLRFCKDESYWDAIEAAGYA